MVIKRDYYLKQLISRKDNGLVKIISGMRRCGKSYLLFRLYKEYLLENGVKENEILLLALDDASNSRYRNPLELDKYVKEFIKLNKGKCYVFIDEIQFVKKIENPWVKEDYIGFVDVVLGLMKIENVDLYITGSNSKMLSSDIVTQFRDRGDIIYLYPLSYSEICKAYKEESEKVWQEYITYGGLPRVLFLSDRKSKIDYLNNLFNKTYVSDVIERHNIKNEKSVLDNLIRIIASSIGSLTNPKKISDTFKSNLNINISQNTIDNYLDYFIESFILNKAYRYDVKGRKYINTPLKYYFSDLGIRNEILEFRQQEENHIMENIIYNELIIRGYSVDVGMVEYRHFDENGKDVRSQLEVDFIAKHGDKQFYIQSALNVDSEDKLQQERLSLIKINNSFKKIVIVKDQIIPWTDEFGICYVGIREFLSGKYPDMFEI